MTMPLVIEKLYAYIAENEEGEGLIAANIGPGGSPMPLVGADMERMTSLWPLAEQTAKGAGVPVRLVEFATRTEIDRIEP